MYSEAVLFDLANYWPSHITCTGHMANINDDLNRLN